MNEDEKKMLDAIIPTPLQRQPDVWIQISVPDEFQKLVNLILVLQLELKLIYVM
jgi:hypothetical protein